MHCKVNTFVRIRRGRVWCKPAGVNSIGNDRYVFRIQCAAQYGVLLTAKYQLKHSPTTHLVLLTQMTWLTSDNENLSNLLV